MFLFPAGPHKSCLGPAPSFCCEVKVSPAPIGLGHPSVRWVHAQFPGRSGEVASVVRGGGRDGACGGEAVGASLHFGGDVFSPLPPPSPHPGSREDLA